jgi:S-adenosylmethionine-dependent methyltransferase
MQVGAQRFEAADKYAAYLRTLEGRLRADLAWKNLLDFLPANAPGLRALDVGGGTGTLAIHMAELGFEVTLLDISERMLALARKESDGRRAAGSISIHRGDAARLPKLFEQDFFHTVTCHNLLEYMENPAAVLRDVASVLRDDGNSIVSLLVRNRWGEVLKAAMKERNLKRAAAVVVADSVLDTLYGEPVRIFDPDDFQKMLKEAGLEPVAVRGVRVASDYTDSEALAKNDYGRLLEIELALGAQPRLAGVARYIQVIARHGWPRAVRDLNGYAIHD